MKTTIKVTALIAAILMAVFPVRASGTAPMAEDLQDVYISTSYENYCQYVLQHSQASYDVPEITVDPLAYTSSAANEQESVHVVNQESGQPVIYTGDTGTLTWQFKAEQAGMYQLEIEYMPAEDTTGTIQREVLLDGQLPFTYAGNILFERTFELLYASEDTDIYGNQLRPKTTVANTWQKKRVADASGQLNGEMYFYLSEGIHTVSLRSIEQSMLIKGIRFVARATTAEDIDTPVSTGNEKPIHMEAEKPTLVSDRSITADYDLSSPNTVPYHATLLRYNILGGPQWSSPGQWVEWRVEVKETGCYKLALRFRQREKANSVSYRRLYVDGVVPSEKAAAIPFSHKNSWQIAALEDSYLHLEAGWHTIRLEAITGPYQDILNNVDGCIRQMNQIYSDVIMVTGPSPDVYRDYQLDKMIPGTIADMAKVKEQLADIVAQVDAITNNRAGQSVAVFNRLIDQLDKMAQKPSTIAETLSDFQSNIINVASWVNDEREQPLELDYLELLPENMAVPKAEAGFCSILIHNLKQFIASFVLDYNNVGAMGFDADKEITVWVSSGQDQLLILRQLLNDEFTPNHNIQVNLQNVASGTLVSATMARIGPDVAMQRAQGEPMNYAYRKAICDLSQFSDIDEVASWFPESSLTPFTYDGHIYGLPETLVYQMLFYRKDILAKLNIAEKELDTWESILQGVIPKMQKSYLEFGIESKFANYAMILYQNGGSIYNQRGTESTLNDPKGIAALEMFCSLYSDYKLPLAFDFYNRFRSGEMPIAVVDSSYYNQLSVFAPELNGLWGIRCVPGVETDGVLNRSVTATVTGSVIMEASQDKESAWEFLKWWLSAQTQEQYGNDLEVVMGSAARYASANLEVIQNINWSKDFKTALMEQREELAAVPEVPGGYFTTRNFDFAFRDIVYNGKDMREVINSSVQTMNREIANKRQEFGLD